MHPTIDTALLRHPAGRYRLPSGPERTAAALQRAERRAAFHAFVAAVFDQPPRHPVFPVVHKEGAARP